MPDRELLEALETLRAYFMADLRAMLREEFAASQISTGQPRKPVLTPREAALETGIPADDWRLLVAEEKLPNLGKPGAIRIPRWAIDEWIQVRR